MSLYNRTLFNRAGGYDETLRHQQDYDLWLRFLFFEEPFFYNRICARYRRHSGSIGEKTKSLPAISPQTRLTNLMQNELRYRNAPRARLIHKGIIFLEAWRSRQWETTIGLGCELSGLGCAGFELDRRMADAFTNLGCRQKALSLAFQWLVKMADGETLLPYERVWALVSCLNLMRKLGRRDDIKRILPLAKTVCDQQHDETLAEAIASAAVFAAG